MLNEKQKCEVLMLKEEQKTILNKRYWTVNTQYTKLNGNYDWVESWNFEILDSSQP